MTGSGIYVKGDASDIQIYADTNGDQVYVVKQGSTTTTVRTSYANNTMTVSQGSSTKTLNGVFKDKSDPLNIKNGSMLFVDGSINSLRGGKDSSGTKPAVASATRLTIAAQRNIFVEGDPWLDEDAVFGVRDSCVAPYVRHEPGETAPDGTPASEPFFTLDYTFRLQPL